MRVSEDDQPCVTDIYYKFLHVSQTSFFPLWSPNLNNQAWQLIYPYVKYWKSKLKACCHYQSFLWPRKLGQSFWRIFDSDNGQRKLWSKTLKDFDGIESHPIFLELVWTLMGIRVEFWNDAVLFNKQKTHGKNGWKSWICRMASKTKKVWTNDVIEELIEMVEARSVILNIKSKDYCDRDKRTSILSAFFRLLCDV